MSVFGEEVKIIFLDVAKSKDFSITSTEVDKDHIHVIISYAPSQSIFKIVKLLKQISTYRIWRIEKCYNILKENYWRKNTFGLLDILHAV